MCEDKQGKWRVAIMYQRSIYEGIAHGLIFYEQIRGQFPEAKLSDCIEGFIVPDGRFLISKDAKKLAESLGLIGPIRPGDPIDVLWTEQLPDSVLARPLRAKGESSSGG